MNSSRKHLLQMGWIANA